MQFSRFTTANLRNFIFGVEDSLVSTVGLISGIAIAGAPKPMIFLTGMVLIFVEAFSMGAGSFLSEHSAEEYQARAPTSHGQPLLNGAIMFFSYFLSGFIPLFPYIIFPLNAAFWISISLSLTFLFILGLFAGKVSKISALRIGLRMVIVGGLAIGIGVAVGKLITL